MSLHERIAMRLQQRWPQIRHQLPRDVALVLVLGLLAQAYSLAVVATDSVHTSLALVIKGAPARPGDLVVFGYAGRPLERYYPEGMLARLQRKVGMEVSLAGPRMGEGLIKYLVGIPGDRVEVEGDQVYLQTRGGRLAVGRCKPTSSHGVPLTPVSPQTIPPGFVYVWAPHADALDSRYAVMGLVPAGALVGKAVKLW
ncbi:Peptidase_S26 domain-containing protein [Rubrivivax sp. A210]|uniref:S26 family signal peptidase n=1 Tax=Rubrivivax sp. A210 TaxID=2772301 RepID=UPI0019180239|nr:S26 family signal peptidase [Rubrivivax sp. A210]CAD5366863.1 Peptidase_S26 domain-containing protein [Rubrivivax sp. A210]